MKMGVNVSAKSDDLGQTTQCHFGDNFFASGKSFGMLIWKFVLGRVVGKGENASYQHFLLFPQCFQKS